MKSAPQTQTVYFDHCFDHELFIIKAFGVNCSCDKPYVYRLDIKK